MSTQTQTPDTEVDARAGATVPPLAHVGLAALTPAGRIAAMSALRDAIDGRIAWEKKVIAEALTGATENQSIHTPLGDLSFQPGKRTFKVDEEKLLEYVKTEAPEMVETKTVVTESIPDFYRKGLIADVAHVGDGLFVRASNGEQVHFMYLGEPTATKISYPSSQLQKQVKATARRVVRDNLERFAAPILAVTDGHA